MEKLTQRQCGKKTTLAFMKWFCECVKTEIIKN